jgi:hypothetical protein
VTGPIKRASKAALAVVGLLLALSTGSCVSAQSISLRSAGTAHPVSSGLQSAAATQAFWNPSRLRSAVSVTRTASGSAQTNAGSVTVAHGSPTMIAPQAPQAGSPAAQATAADGATAPDSGLAPQVFPGTDAYSYPPPATNIGAVAGLGAPVTRFPWAPNGALFFHDPVGGGNFRCSAGAINSQNLSVVFTAGHCVANGGRAYFYSNWAFCPAYDATLFNPCQLGLFTARTAWTWGGWFFNGTLALDLGAVVMNCSNGQPGNNVGACPSGGSPIVRVTGGEGIAFNLSATQHFWNIGYPAAPPYDGSRMDLSTASTNHLDPFQGQPSTLGIGTNFTGGSSGGQWYVAFSGGGGYANGHNDYIYTSQPAQIFSPYYGNEAAALYNAAATS